MRSVATPPRYSDPEHCVDATLERVGKTLVMGLPVALGKPNVLANAFVRRAVHDRSIQLRILTALSFRKPRWHSDLERRFLQPFAERVFGDYPELEYLRLLDSGELPSNIRVTEFFLEPGAWLSNGPQQRNYLSANYTHVVRDAVKRGLNVMAQLVAPAPAGEAADSLSLSCNADLTADLLPEIVRMRAAGRPFALIGQVHRGLPFMYGDAQVATHSFDLLLDDPKFDFPLFCPPNMPIGDVEYHIALHTAVLIKDGGTLQLGIGELGDAIVYALKLRHQRPEVFRRLVAGLGIRAQHPALLDAIGGTQSFERGLYGCSEMLVDGFLDLHRAGILKRPAYASARIQRLLDDNEIGEDVDARILEALHDSGISHLSFTDFKELQDVGVFREDVSYEHGALIAPDGMRIALNLADPDSRAALAEHCLGPRLSNGILLDSGFFFGPKGFYAALHAMPAQERKRFAMRGISFINELYGPEFELKCAQRRHARFVNTAMMVTGLGAAVSDGLADGRVVSGVGGQYNFVAMAHALPEGRSILCLRSMRDSGGAVSSNIVWSYGHVTIPRHLRDIVITEYGIADLRGKTDGEVVAALAEIMDARFQEGFIADARRAGKLAADFRVSDKSRSNLPQRLANELEIFRQEGFFGALPFGSDFTAEELVLGKALKRLKAQTISTPAKLRAAASAVMRGQPPARLKPYLARLELDRPVTAMRWLEQRLVTQALLEIEHEAR